MAIIFARAAALAAALLPCAAIAVSLSLDTALELAVQRSESARAAHAGVSSAVEAARAAGQLPDPTLRAGVENVPVTGSDRFSSSRDSMAMRRIGIGQEWLSREKRGARQAAADAAVAREKVTAQAARAEVRLQTAWAYLDAFYAREARELMLLAERQAREEVEVARGRLAAATGSGQDVLALISARGVAEDAAAEAGQVQDAAHVVLERWIGKEPDGLEAADPGPAVSEPVYVAGYPAVAALQRDVELARRSAEVTASDRKPNWTWEVSYGQRTGYSDMLSVGVSIPLPVSPGARQDRDTAAKLALVDKAEAELAEAIRAATGEHRALSSDARRLQDRIEHYRVGAVLAAQQRTAVATASYGSNQSGLTSLFEARRAEIEARRKLLALRRDLARIQAQMAYKPIATGAWQ